MGESILLTGVGLRRPEPTHPDDGGPFLRREPSHGITELAWIVLFGGSDSLESSAGSASVKIPKQVHPENAVAACGSRLGRPPDRSSNQ